MLKYIKYAFVAGAVSALLSIAYFYGSLILDINPLGGSKAFSYILMLLMFFPALWHFRKTYLADEMHFHQAFVLSFLVNLFACLFFAVFVGIYLSWLDSNLLTQHIAESKLFFMAIKEDYVKANGLEAFQKSYESLEKISVSDIVKDEFAKRFFILLFFVLLASFVMRRSPSWAISK